MKWLDGGATYEDRGPLTVKGIFPGPRSAQEIKALPSGEVHEIKALPVWLPAELTDRERVLTNLTGRERVPKTEALRGVTDRSVIDALVAEGVVESQRGASTGGRPPVFYRLKREESADEREGCDDAKHLKQEREK